MRFFATEADRVRAQADHDQHKAEVAHWLDSMGAQAHAGLADLMEVYYRAAKATRHPTIPVPRAFLRDVLMLAGYAVNDGALSLEERDHVTP